MVQKPKTEVGQSRYNTKQYKTLTTIRYFNQPVDTGTIVFLTDKEANQLRKINAVEAVKPELQPEPESESEPERLRKKSAKAKE